MPIPEITAITYCAECEAPINTTMCSWTCEIAREAPIEFQPAVMCKCDEVK